MGVFHDDDHRSLQFGQHRSEDNAAPRGGQDVAERAADLRRDVVQRPQRTRRKQRVAAAPQDPHAGAMAAHEILDQRRLADARLAPDQHNATFATDGVLERHLEVAQCSVAVEEVHSGRRGGRASS